MSPRLHFVLEVARGLLFISLVALAVPTVLFGYVLAVAGVGSFPAA